MRAIRFFVLFVLAVVLILIAIANRAPITVNLVPESLQRFTQGAWAVTVPAFLALFLAMAFGLVIGLVWEWLRESGQRSTAKARTRELNRLERELGDMRRTHAKPKDEVLAILDDAVKPAPGAPGLPAAR